MQTIRKIHQALTLMANPNKSERAALALAEAQSVYLRDLV